MVVRLRHERLGNARPQVAVGLRRYRDLPAAVARVVEHVGDAHDPRRGLDKTEVHAAQLHPVAVGAGVNAVKRPAARRVGLKRPRFQGFRHHFRLVQQAPGHQGRFHGASPTRLLSGQQRRRNADGGEQRRPDAG